MIPKATPDRDKKELAGDKVDKIYFRDDTDLNSYAVARLHCKNMLPFPDLTGLKRYQPRKLKRVNSDGEVKGYTFAYKKKYTGWLDALQNTRKKNMKL